MSSSVQVGVQLEAAAKLEQLAEEQVEGYLVLKAHVKAWASSAALV